MGSVRNTRPDSVRSAVSASILTIAVTASIQSSTANSETSALSGRCQETAGKKKWRWSNREIGRWGDGEMGMIINEEIRGSGIKNPESRFSFQPLVEKRGQSLEMILFFLR